MKHRFLFIIALLLTAATGAWADDDPAPISLTSSANGTVWTLSTMPAYDVELEIEYYDPATLTAAPTAATGLEYTGGAQNLINAGTATGGTLYYGLGTSEAAPTDASAWSETVPTGTDVGQYYVWYKVVGNETHGDIAPAGPLSVTIAKATPTISEAPTAGAITYGQTLAESTLNGGSATYNSQTVAGSFAWTTSTTAPSVSDSKTTEYEVTFTPTDGTNYNSATTNVKLTVNPGSMTEGITVTPYNAAYNASAHGITVALSGVAEGATVKYRTAETGEYYLTDCPTYTDAGEYTIYYQVTKANYTTVESSATVTITKATATISYATTEVNKAFGNAAFINTLTKTPATGTGLGIVTYAVTAETKDEGCTSEHVAAINASTGEVTITGTGSATITATATDGDNYTYGGTNTATYTLTVAKGTITASAYSRSYTYDGYSHSIDVSVSKPSSGYTIQYSTDNSTWSSSKPSRTNVGSTYIYYKVTAPNYNDYSSYAYVTISRATGSIAFDPAEVEKTYGDDNFTKTYSSKTGNGSITYSSDDENVATVTNSGVVTIKDAGTAHIKVSMAQSTNYTSASATYTLTVNPADLSKAAVMLNPLQTTFEYDGNAKEPAVMFVILGDTKILAAGTEYTVSYANNVNAGTPTDENAPTVVVTGTGNYSGTATVAFTITPKTTIMPEGNVTVVNGGDYTELTVTDMGNQPGSTLPEGLEVTTLNYKRTLNENDEQAYTVCLPYNPPTDSKLEYYTLAGCNGTTLSFQEISGTPQAETPYLVLAAATTDIGQQDVHDVTMSKEVTNNSEAGGYVLKGTLSGIDHDNAIGLYILQSGNRWGRVGSDPYAYIPPFRAYIEATASGARMLDSSFGDEATGINSLRTIDRDGTERYFDLNGRRIEKPATKGIYIHNGRKEVLK